MADMADDDWTTDSTLSEAELRSRIAAEGWQRVLALTTPPGTGTTPQVYVPAAGHVTTVSPNSNAAAVVTHRSRLATGAKLSGAKLPTQG